MTIFFRVLKLSADDRPEALRRAVASVRSGGHVADVFDRSPEAFAAVPGSPFAYWVSDSLRSAFARLGRVETSSRTVKQGLVTTDDSRFLRGWWEVAEDRLGAAWFGFAKGGSFSRFYADVHLVVDWREEGRQSWAIYEARRDVVGGIIKNPDYYLRPGLTWPLRTNGLSFRLMPAGCVFSHKGPAVFVEGNLTDEMLSLNAVLNSQVFGYLVSIQLARTALAQSYEVGIIQRTPVPDLTSASRAVFAQLARRAWSLKRSLDTANENSHAFLLPSCLNERVTGLTQAAVEQGMAAVQREIDELGFDVYGIGPEDRATIEAPSKRDILSDEDAEAADSEGDEVEEALAGADAATLSSWLVGVTFARFDPRLATGERAIPREPEPFDPLPARSPGMYPDGEEPVDCPDVLVDDEGHTDDLAARATAVAERVKIDVPEALRAWLAKEFFPLHIRMYSKSRRKAPIYWQLATPSASYAVWLYIHAFTKDTLFRVQNDYAAPKLAHEERRLESLNIELRDGATAAQRKELAAQEGFVEELRAFLDEVKRVAPLWNPNLDDGAIINFAPLWRLVPQHKSWQKELKSTWDALCEGEYDWAHLSMHLWPERVVPKCAKDRSLAIAHGLEEVFWVEDTDGKWTARKKPTRSVDELVRERISPAVKAALKSLLEAPVASGGSGRGRGGGRRKTAGATEGEGR